ncbi:putative 1,2-phenylacetyl-CoA epoxidase, subunit D [Micromonospora sp. MH33]|uniref:1,2-phenylacetyl-CoA epoxidase subunit PaaD n=1 Tax=Micromonospora sp. MH33 TaxID=1945509 RepID=UPI000D14B5CA|nr:1,2-phenylacetyl-CoA epoxidase subunit PaaD [Micromonospora sp. MH33]PSK64314.1 putative 1,2-phenylacetyl-CoA epoxidase, subunit D [Micromonospora sp. MH33]
MTDPRAAVAAVVDPEIRVITIDELGILRSVDQDPATGRVVVTITPTYTGCPAMDVIRTDIRRALTAAGHSDAEVRTVYAPAWSTDWISERGRAKLAAAGIAPPAPAARGGGVVPLTLAVRCPRCGSPETEQVSRFGSTACKALWRCRSCSEPFDHLKAL